MRRELEEELQELAPTFLQEMNCNELESCMAFGIECGDGWFVPLADFCRRVEELNKSMPDKIFVANKSRKSTGISAFTGICMKRGKRPGVQNPPKTRKKRSNSKLSYGSWKLLVKLNVSGAELRVP